MISTASIIAHPPQSHDNHLSFKPWMFPYETGAYILEGREQQMCLDQQRILFWVLFLFFAETLTRIRILGLNYKGAGIDFRFKPLRTESGGIDLEKQTRLEMLLDTCLPGSRCTSRSDYMEVILGRIPNWPAVWDSARSAPKMVPESVNGFWYVPDDSGKGLALQVQGPALFCSWFGHTDVGLPIWYACWATQAGDSYTGDQPVVFQGPYKEFRFNADGIQYLGEARVEFAPDYQSLVFRPDAGAVRKLVPYPVTEADVQAQKKTA